MEIWTTFCPSKICWELTYAQTSFGSAQDKKASPTSKWLDNQILIEASLKQLKHAGIQGIRLVIFPSEVTKDGKRFDWTPFEIMLAFCKKLRLSVNFCLGPFQYPYYPGIYLPPNLITYVYDNDNALDTNPELRRYGMSFLQAQLEKYGDDPRIHSFHLANEWPDSQHVANKEKIKKIVSEDFMTRAASLLKVTTEKPITLNTNIDATDKRRLTKTFANILSILGKQGNLGFDIYPSQETWMKVPLIKLKRFFEPYFRSFRSAKKTLRCDMYFCEVEAQPWGNGQAWFTLIGKEIDPQQKVLSYTNESLQKTWKEYIKHAKCHTISLWGADFWLVASEMGLKWPLEQVKKLSS